MTEFNKEYLSGSDDFLEGEEHSLNQQSKNFLSHNFGKFRSLELKNKKASLSIYSICAGFKVR